MVISLIAFVERNNPASTTILAVVALFSDTINIELGLFALTVIKPYTTTVCNCSKSLASRPP